LTEKIALFNCYSTSNSGDGLLVDLAVAEIKKRHPTSEVTIVASDPSSFVSDSYRVIPNEFAVQGVKFVPWIILKLVLFIVFGGYRSTLYTPIKSFDAVYSVGGGYIRFGSCLETLKTVVVHLSQLAWINSNFTGPHVLFSQSIGPFRVFTPSLLKCFLNHTQQIQLRDDRSFNDLADRGLNIVRCKDFAVQEFIHKMQNFANAAESGSVTLKKKECVVVLRDLRLNHKNTVNILKKLDLALNGFDVIYATQSTVGGNNDDEFYSKYGMVSSGKLKEVLLVHKDAIVLSVRLHGAIESMLSGNKTFHLSYERKGFGAFEDMNLQEFVANVYAFDEKDIGVRLNKLWEISNEVYFNRNTK
jgi:polysaccharide pyruvyl transferase WcaK-like protein